jgi:hypothetical protein
MSSEKKVRPAEQLRTIVTICPYIRGFNVIQQWVTLRGNLFRLLAVSELLRCSRVFESPIVEQQAEPVAHASAGMNTCLWNEIYFERVGAEGKEGPFLFSSSSDIHFLECCVKEEKDRIKKRSSECHF